MSIKVFLKIDGIAGSCKDEHHIDWIDVHDFYWFANHSQDKILPNEKLVSNLTVDVPIDKATPTVFLYCANEKKLTSVILSFCDKDHPSVETNRITLSDVLVTHVELKWGSNPKDVYTTYQLQPNKIQFSHWGMSQCHSRGAEVRLGWDIKENKAL